MVKEGSIALFRFPQTNQKSGKLRPALVIKRVSDSYDDWLICMISTQVHQKINGLDELIDSTDEDYTNSGLKETSLFRVSRLAVVEEASCVQH